MDKQITKENLKKFEEAYDKDALNKIVENAVRKNGVFNTCYNSSALKDLNPIFNVEVNDAGDVLNQKQSGRCWMFSGLNILRQIIIKNLNVKDIELSESYLMFYDKLEKSNCELEETLNHLEEKNNSRLLDTIINLGGHLDGGYWSFFVNLVTKYGVCPKDVMGESVASSSSSEMNDIINQLLVKDISILRNKYKNGSSIEELRIEKEHMLNDIYRVLCICIGKPINEFTYEYEVKADKDNKDEKNDENKIKSLKTTPIEFFNTYVKKDLEDYVLLVNWPIEGYEFYKPYETKMLTNVYLSTSERSINLPIDELKEAAIKSLKDKTLCWFACDVGAYSMRKEGYLATELFPFNQVFSTDFKVDKGERLNYRSSQCTHAMTLSGVNLDENNKPNRWKVTNSWGKDVGFNGQYVMSDDWFNEFVYEVVVDKKYLNDKILKAMKEDTIYIEPWAPVTNN